MANILDTLGNWQDPAKPIDQSVVKNLLDQMVDSTPANSTFFPYMRAVRAEFARLSGQEYFSEVGRTLTLRQLCESLDSARSVDACRGLKDTFSIPSDKILGILDADIYRDGGSRFVLLATTSGELPALLPIAWRNGTAIYRDLYPCDFSSIDYFLPIPRGSTEDSFLLSGIRSILNLKPALEPNKLQRAHEFLSAAETRER